MFYDKFALVALSSLVIVATARAWSSGPPDGYAGDPPDRSTCVACHNSFALNSGAGALALTGLPEGYQAGERYRLTLRLSDPNASRWGFELTVLDPNNRPLGTLNVVNAQQTQISRGGNGWPDYLKQRSAGTFSGQRNAAEWAFDWTAPEQADLPAAFYYTGNAANNNGASSGDRIYAASAALEPAGPPVRQLTVQLRQGWNLISMNLVPSPDFFRQGEERGPDVVLLTDQLRIDQQRHRISLVKDENGRFYSPQFGFNNIPFWNLTEGYLVKVEQATEISWEGEPIPFDEEIPLAQGWNFIAYFPEYELSAAAPDFPVLAPIINRVLIAKDENGNFLNPQFRFSNMPPWRPGRGYQVKVDANVVLRYPADPNGD